jgi:beta-glucosidase
VRSQFYANRTFSGTPIVDIDSEINVYTGSHAPRPGLPAGNFSVRYTATLTAPTTGSYTFTLTGTARLILDGKTVIDCISSSKNPSTGSMTLTAGSHSLEVDAVASAAAFVAQLTWVVPGSPEANPAAALASAVALAAAADVAVVVVSDLSGEGRDRTTYSLPGNQDTLISQVVAVNPRTVVVLTTSAPVSIENWIATTPAALWAGYHGQEGGEAVAALIFGETNPAGKLPITWAKSANDYPATTPQQYPGVNNVETYSEGIYIGYRHFDQAGITPRFPFGHGLSYTSFGYSGLTIDAVSPGAWNVGATVTNTGARSGTEVAQLYVGPSAGSSPPVDMPPRQLKGFQRVDLAAGESTQVVFSLTTADFAAWNDSAGAMEAVPDTYEIEVGNPSGSQLSGQVVVS